MKCVVCAPRMLTGEGGRMWAGQHGCQLCESDELITDRARQVYVNHKSLLDGATPTRKRRRVSVYHSF